LNPPEHYLPNLIAYVQCTRRYGHCYVHACVRQSMFSFEGVIAEVNGRRVRLTWTGYGRSLQSGGHKYKAHARFQDTDRPVPSALLRSIAPIAEGGAQ
jgi:hypothetical protein